VVAVPVLPASSSSLSNVCDNTCGTASKSLREARKLNAHFVAQIGSPVPPLMPFVPFLGAFGIPQLRHFMRSLMVENHLAKDSVAYFL
jgi:hypothetical protein